MNLFSQWVSVYNQHLLRLVLEQFKQSIIEWIECVAPVPTARCWALTLVMVQVEPTRLMWVLVKDARRLMTQKLPAGKQPTLPHYLALVTPSVVRKHFCIWTSHSWLQLTPASQSVSHGGVFQNKHESRIQLGRLLQGLRGYEDVVKEAHGYCGTQR